MCAYALIELLLSYGAFFRVAIVYWIHHLGLSAWYRKTLGLMNIMFGDSYPERT